MTKVKELKSRANVFTPFTGCAQIYHQRWYIYVRPLGAVKDRHRINLCRGNQLQQEEP